MDNPDGIRKIGVTHEYLSGDIGEQILGFRKEPVIFALRPVLTPQETRFLTKWWLADTKKAIYFYGAYTSFCATGDTLQSRWLNDFEFGRIFEVEFTDTKLYTEFDVKESVADALMYCKLEVKIVGTSDSVETFETSVHAELLTMEDGTAWPVFDDAVNVHTVILTPAKSCQCAISLTEKPSVSNDNVVFKAFVSDFQSPASDGYYYMDVHIFLQERA
jgi:hypothetical protein